jgi:hypothetical protein
MWPTSWRSSPRLRTRAGWADSEFDSVFTEDKPVIFASHRYPWLIHRLTYERNNHDNFHAHGYREEGTTTIPFDMTVLSRLDRLHLAADRPRATESECRGPCEAAPARPSDGAPRRLDHFPRRGHAGDPELAVAN